MNLTEKEARYKWCPFARVVEVDEESSPLAGWPVGNRSTQHYSHPSAKCVASECMAWRWDTEDHEYATTRNLTDDEEKTAARLKTHPHELSLWKKPEGEPPLPPGEGWEPAGEIKQSRNYATGVFERDWQRPINRRGRCGLAGRPE